MNRLKPWLQLHLSKKKKKMVLQEGTAKSEKPTVKPSSEPNIITWSVTFAAPEMTLILYSLDDIPLYHVSSFRYLLFQVVEIMLDSLKHVCIALFFPSMFGSLWH